MNIWKKAVALFNKLRRVNPLVRNKELDYFVSTLSVKDKRDLRRRL